MYRGGRTNFEKMGFTALLGLPHNVRHCNRFRYIQYCGTTLSTRQKNGGFHFNQWPWQNLVTFSVTNEGSKWWCQQVNQAWHFAFPRVERSSKWCVVLRVKNHETIIWDENSQNPAVQVTQWYPGASSLVHAFFISHDGRCFLGPVAVFDTTLHVCSTMWILRFHHRYHPAFGVSHNRSFFLVLGYASKAMIHTSYD